MANNINKFLTNMARSTHNNNDLSGSARELVLPRVGSHVNDNVKIFVSQDRAVIKSYYEFRNEIYISENGYDHEKWTKTEHDDNSIVVVVTENDEVVGGVRLLFSMNGELLSDEYENTDFVYKKVLDGCGLEASDKYCQIDDMVLSKKYRNGVFTKSVIEFCVKKSRERGCIYIFFVASLAHCRLYRRYFMLIGCKEVMVAKGMIWRKIEEYNLSEDHPAVVVI